tara:strand:- start:4975 stop:5703 length:729 start_codon:yes stop_codon:yes gene_type:complete
MTDELNTEIRFSIIPEWVTYSQVSDKAVRLYSVLARYADNHTHEAFPSRETLAEKMGCSAKSIDRASQELIRVGAITKRQRHNSSLVYTLRVSKGVDTSVQGGWSPLSRGVDTDVHLTRTTELEPDNYIDKKAKRATSIPDPFALEDTFVDALRKKHPSLDIGEQIDAFVDFHTAKGSVFKSWDAAFRTWCRNAVRFAEPRTVIHKQALKPAAEGPTERGWVSKMHDIGEHWECRPGEFGCR